MHAPAACPGDQTKAARVLFQRKSCPQGGKNLLSPLQKSLGAALTSHSADTQHKHSNHKAQNFRFTALNSTFPLWLLLPSVMSTLQCCWGFTVLPIKGACSHVTVGDVGCRQIQQQPLEKCRVLKKKKNWVSQGKCRSTFSSPP